MKKILKSKIFMIFSGIVLVVLITISVFVSTHFLPNTIINTVLGDIDVGYAKKDFLASELRSQIESGKISIYDYKGQEYKYKLSDFYDIDYKKLLNIINSKSYLNWSIGSNKNIDFSDFCKLDPVKIDNMLLEIQDEVSIQAKPAFISYNEDKEKYEIEPEVYGNEYTQDSNTILRSKFVIGNHEYNLFDMGCYILPTILRDNPNLVKQLKDMNDFLETRIVFTFGDIEEVVDRSIYQKWITYKYDNGVSVEVDEEQLNIFVDSLCQKYNTLNLNRHFVTSTNEEVELNTGSYGWAINKEFVYDILLNGIKNKESGKYEFKYDHEATVKSLDDIGDTYVEVSIKNQKVWMYIDGELLIESSVVTGCTNLGRGTRKGVFTIAYKTRNAVLRGPGYASPVSYWMPFDGGIGLHDATWRSSFGGTIYVYNGSHGCVNLPLKTAKTIYEHIDETVPIIVW